MLNCICLSFLNEFCAVTLLAMPAHFAQSFSTQAALLMSITSRRGPGCHLLLDISCKGTQMEDGFNIQLYPELKSSPIHPAFGTLSLLVIIAEPLISISNFYF